MKTECSYRSVIVFDAPFRLQAELSRYNPARRRKPKKRERERERESQRISEREREKERETVREREKKREKSKIKKFPQEASSLLAINQIGPLLDR